MVEKEWSKLQSELAMLHGYTMILMRELWAARILVPLSPHIPGRRPVVPPYESGYMLAPPSSPGGWDSFAQTQGPSQDPRYTPGASGGASPSTDPFTGNDDDDNDDADFFFRDDDPQ